MKDIEKYDSGVLYFLRDWFKLTEDNYELVDGYIVSEELTFGGKGFYNSYLHKMFQKPPFGCYFDKKNLTIIHKRTNTVIAQWIASESKFKILAMKGINGDNDLLYANNNKDDWYINFWRRSRYIKVTTALIDNFYLCLLRSLCESKNNTAIGEDYIVMEAFEDCSMQFLENLEAVYNTMRGEVAFRFLPESNCFCFTDTITGIDFAWVHIIDNHVSCTLFPISPGSYPNRPVTRVCGKYVTEHSMLIKRRRCPSNGHVKGCSKWSKHDVCPRSEQEKCIAFLKGNPDSEFSQIIKRFRTKNTQCYHVKNPRKLWKIKQSSDCPGWFTYSYRDINMTAEEQEIRAAKIFDLHELNI